MSIRVRRVVAAALTAACAAVVPARPAEAATVEEAAMVAEVNAVRAGRNVRLLELHPELERKAQDWAAHLAAVGRLEHSVATEGITADWSSLAENVAVDFTSDAAAAQLLSSPAHYANIVDADMTHIGVGIAAGGDYVYVVQEFMQLDTDGAGAAAPPDATADTTPPSPTAPADVAPPPSPAASTAASSSPAPAGRKTPPATASRNKPPATSPSPPADAPTAAAHRAAPPPAVPADAFRPAVAAGGETAALPAAPISSTGAPRTGTAAAPLVVRAAVALVAAVLVMALRRRCRRRALPRP